MSLIRETIKNHFHTNDFALSLAMKERFGVTWRWSIKTDGFQLKNKETKQSKAKSAGRFIQVYVAMISISIPYSSRNSAVTLTSHKGPNVGLGESICGCHFPDILH